MIFKSNAAAWQAAWKEKFLGLTMILEQPISTLEQV